MSHLVAPSMLSADFGNLQQAVELINKSEADWFHLDVMDGVFVPNISFGMPVISAIKKIAQKPLDVHLMIVHPERYIADFKQSGADILTVHYESVTHLNRTVNAIKEEGMKAGVVLNPHTNVLLLEDIINDVDLVLLMSVNPGFGGQKFIDNTYLKIERLKEMTLKKGSKALIEVDGGVNLTNAEKLVRAGVDVLVAGNSIFKSGDIISTIQALKQV